MRCVRTDSSSNGAVVVFENQEAFAEQMLKHQGYHPAKRPQDTRRLKGVGEHIIVANEKDSLQLEGMHKLRKVLLKAVNMR